MNVLVALLYGLSIFAMIVMAIANPLVGIAFVGMWWAIIRIGIWMTRERDEQRPRDEE